MELATTIHEASFFPENKDLRITNFIKDKKDFLLLTNEGEIQIDSYIHMNSGYKIEYWDAWQGKISEIESNCTEMEICLRPRESKVLSLTKNYENRE